MQPNTAETRRYRILEVLGRGGFGTVYKAELRAAGGFTKPVALKVLHPDVQHQDDVVARLKDEARMLGLLRHRSIVQVDGLIQLAGRWSVVMEYVEGVSLKELLGAGALPTTAALEICEEVAHALHAAFAKPVRDGQPLHLLHRDVKPSNIQVTAGGEVKLLDFGVARANFGEREAESQSIIYGSLPYMAPERLEFEDSDRSDVFALGITLAEALLGHAFPGKPSGHPDRHRERVEGGLSELWEVVGHPSVVDLIRRCLSYEPAHRPTAEQFAHQARDLRQVIEGPWLREWCEEAVPPVLERRTPDDGDLTGSMLMEHSESLGVDQELSLTATQSATASQSAPALVEPKHPEAQDTQGKAPPTMPFSLPPTPAPQLKKPPPPPPARPAQEAAPRVKTHSTCWTVFKVAAVLCTLLTLAGLGVMLLFGVGTAGLVAAVWPQARQESVVESFQDMQVKAKECKESRGKRYVLKLLADGEMAAYRDTIGLFEIVAFEGSFDQITKDKRITDAEAKALKAHYDRIVRN